MAVPIMSLMAGIVFLVFIVAIGPLAVVF